MGFGGIPGIGGTNQEIPALAGMGGRDHSWETGVFIERFLLVQERRAGGRNACLRWLLCGFLPLRGGGYG